MLSINSFPAIFLSLLLCISLADALAIGHHERYHRVLKRASREFRDAPKMLYPRLFSGAVTAGTAAPSGFIGTSSRPSNYTFTALPASAKTSNAGASVLTGAVFVEATATFTATIPGATLETTTETVILDPAAAASGSAGSAATSSPAAVASVAAASVATDAAAATSAKPTGPTPAGYAVGSIVIAETATFTYTPVQVTQIVQVYQICENSAGTTVNCEAVQQTVTTSACSTVLTGFFTKATVSQCDQSITFSTKSSFNLITPTAAATAVQKRDSSYSIQSIVSYFIAPWQSIAADNPTGITVLVCTIDASGEHCNGVQQAWGTTTTLQPRLVTTTVSISSSLATAALIVLPGSQTVSASAGDFTLVTTIVFSTEIPYTITIASNLGPSTSTFISNLALAATTATSAGSAAPQASATVTTQPATSTLAAAAQTSGTAFLDAASAQTSSSDPDELTTTHTFTAKSTTTVRIALVSTATTTIPLSTGTGISNGTIASACLWRNSTIIATGTASKNSTTIIATTTA